MKWLITFICAVSMSTAFASVENQFQLQALVNIQTDKGIANKQTAIALSFTKTSTWTQTPFKGTPTATQSATATITPDVSKFTPTPTLSKT